MYEDIYRVIFSFICNESSYLSILLTCKSWLNYGYKYLDFTIKDNKLIMIACRRGKIETVIRLLQDSRIHPL